MNRQVNLLNINKILSCFGFILTLFWSVHFEMFIFSRTITISETVAYIAGQTDNEVLVSDRTSMIPHFSSITHIWVDNRAANVQWNKVYNDFISYATRYGVMDNKAIVVFSICNFVRWNSSRSAPYHLFDRGTYLTLVDLEHSWDIRWVDQVSS
jgi:hypothetical protein